MEETKQQPLALRVCAELAGSFLLCFAIYAFSTWGSAVYGINIVFFALATGLAYAAVTAIFSRVSGGQLNPAITVASVLVSKTKILDGILYVIAQVIGAIAAGFAVVKLLPTSEQVAAKVWLTPAVNGFEKRLRVLLAADPVWHYVLDYAGDCRRGRCLSDCRCHRHVFSG